MKALAGWVVGWLTKLLASYEAGLAAYVMTVH